MPGRTYSDHFAAQKGGGSSEQGKMATPFKGKEEPQHTANLRHGGSLQSLGVFGTGIHTSRDKNGAHETKVGKEIGLHKSQRPFERGVAKKKRIRVTGRART